MQKIKALILLPFVENHDNGNTVGRRQWFKYYGNYLKYVNFIQLWHIKLSKPISSALNLAPLASFKIILG